MMISDPHGCLQSPNFVGERHSGSIHIAKGVSCEWILRADGLHCIWDPSPPASLSRVMKRRYRAGRDRFFIEHVVPVFGEGLVVLVEAGK